MRAIENISEIEEEKLWMNSISRNPAFDFLSEPSEDIYTPKDGEPFNDNIKPYPFWKP
ncbi:MAG: hypothetical protein Q7J86_03185 [Bacteroidota bacterium]|nr:hypothetical protein [Bacteroidota bacterium]